MKRQVALINPNTSSATTARMLEIAIAASADAFALTGVTAPFGVSLITNPTQLETAAKAVLAAARGVTADGIIVSAFGDPGADALAEEIRLPVVGIGAAAMMAAAAGGRRFSIATTTPDLCDSIRQRAARLGLRDHFVSIRLTEGIHFDADTAPEALRAALAEATQRAVDDGAEAVIIGGGPLAVAARALAGTFRVPLIEPIPEAVRLMTRLIAASPPRNLTS